MPRRNLPKQILGNLILIRGLNLFESKTVRHSCLAFVSVFLVADDPSCGVDGALRKAQLNVHQRSYGDRAFVRDGKAAAIEIAGEALGVDRRPLGRLKIKSHRDLELAGETITCAQLSASFGPPHHRGK